MRDSKIIGVDALEILDSRGNPTLQVTLKSDSGHIGKACVPSGASTGEHEAIELRDKDEKRFLGKGCQKAVKNVEEKIAPLILNSSPLEQRKLDARMIEGDGTGNKAKWGANAILGVSLALARLGSQIADLPLYRYIGGVHARTLPCPMLNILNGGVHADNGLAFQEFMIRPFGAPNFSTALRWGAEIFHTLKAKLKSKGYATSVGDEGGFAPKVQNHEEAIELILLAIREAGYNPGKEVSLALDCASSEFYDAKTKTYNSEGKRRSAEEQISYLEMLCAKYPIDSIEDGLAENDWDGWEKLTKILGQKVQLVGDDIFVTNTQFVREGLHRGVANSVLIKPNQVGTLTETLDCIALAKAHGYTTVLSHRSGETEDTFISDLAVATESGQIKTGSLCRSERTAKYNRLLEIEKELGNSSRYRDSNFCRLNY